MSIACVLLFAAFIIAILSAIGKAPLWVAVILQSIAGLLTCLPLR